MHFLRLCAVASLATTLSWAGTEAFVAPAEFSTGVIPDADVNQYTSYRNLHVIAPGDFNGDGKPDVVVAGKDVTGQ